jgi:predicted PP-loop superfamily ATPase
LLLRNREKLFNHSNRRKILNQITPKNYTDSMVADLVSGYTTKEGSNKDFVAGMATKLGRSTKSIVAKLVSLNLYKTEAKVTKTGAKIVHKSELVGQIERHFGIDLPSLVKATKNDLQSLVDQLD